MKINKGMRNGGFGQYVLDMETLPEPLDLKPLFVTST
jgi:hypothetical protein